MLDGILNYLILFITLIQLIEPVCPLNVLCNAPDFPS